jgi:hypothetical protein
VYSKYDIENEVEKFIENKLSWRLKIGLGDIENKVGNNIKN